MQTLNDLIDATIEAQLLDQGEFEKYLLCIKFVILNKEGKVIDFIRELPGLTEEVAISNIKKHYEQAHGVTDISVLECDIDYAKIFKHLQRGLELNQKREG